MFEQAYIFFCALGYALGFAVYFFLARRSGQSSREIIEIFAAATMCSLFGAKIFHTLFEATGHMLPNGEIAEGVWDLIRADPWHWARLFSHGHVFWGALIGALAGVSVLLIAKGVSRSRSIADCLAPAIALGLCVGRIGCFVTGCCFGIPMDLGPISFEALPTQLIESGFAFLCFAWLMRTILRPHRDGGVILLLIASYSVFRFIIEFFRADSDRGFWLGGWLSTSQLLSVCVLAALTLIYWIELDRRVQAKLS